MAAPRFDIFSSQLLDRTWKGERQHLVEEVMRSCGGAVQGIRDGGHYLNRANDGFIFLNDGSYSFGPAVVKNTKEGNEQLLVWRHCFMLSPEERVLCDLRLQCGGTEQLDVSKCIREEAVVEAVLLGAPMGLRCPSEVQCTDSTDDSVRTMHPSFMVRCRMPSSSQPWNIQRVKWETNFAGEYARTGVDKADDAVVSYSLTDSHSSFELACHLKSSTGAFRRTITRSYTTASGTLRNVVFEETTPQSQ